MDGVIYHGNYLLPGVKEFIDWLSANDKSTSSSPTAPSVPPRELQ